MKRHLLVVVVVSIFGLQSGAFADAVDSQAKKAGPAFDKGSVIEIAGSDKIDPKMAKPADPSVDPKMIKSTEGASIQKGKLGPASISMLVAAEALENCRKSNNKAAEAALSESLRPRNPNVKDYQAAIKELENEIHSGKDNGLSEKEIQMLKSELTSAKKDYKEFLKNNPKLPDEAKIDKEKACPVCALRAMEAKNNQAAAKDFAAAQNVIDRRLSELMSEAKSGAGSQPASTAKKIAEYQSLKSVLTEMASANAQQLNPNAVVNQSSAKQGPNNAASAGKKSKQLPDQNPAPSSPAGKVEQPSKAGIAK